MQIEPLQGQNMYFYIEIPFLLITLREEIFAGINFREFFSRAFRGN